MLPCFLFLSSYQRNQKAQGSRNERKRKQKRQVQRGGGEGVEEEARQPRQSAHSGNLLQRRGWRGRRCSLRQIRFPSVISV